MKKVVSLLLVFAMVFSLVAGMGITSDAYTAHTQSEAVSWANSQVGKSLDYDGVYGAQCVDLIKYYYKYLGVSPVTGNGSDYASNSLPSGWSRIKYYSGFVAQPGDVAVWSYLSSSAGHVGIVTSANSTGMNLVDQNGATAPAHVVKTCWKNYSSGTFYGVIRPDFSGGGTSTKTPANLGNDFYAYIIRFDTWKHLANENNNLQISSTGNDCIPRQIWHFIRQSNGSYRIESTYDNRSLDADCAGTANGTNVKMYNSYDTAAQKWLLYANGSGYNIASSYCDNAFDCTAGSSNAGTNVQLHQSNNTAAQIFSIYKYDRNNGVYVKPGVPNKVSVTTSVSGKTVTVKWNSAPLKSDHLDNREYDIRIYKNSTSNSPIYTKFGIKNTSYSYTLSDAGTYYVTVAAVNAKYYSYFSMSDAARFTISATCSHSYSSKITTAATCTATGVKTFTCSKCGNSYTQSIAALGHNYKASITKAATCTEKGVKTFKCSRCTSSYTQDIAALGHNWVKSVQPACIEYEGSWDGYSETKCNRCSASSKKTIPAIDRMILSSERFVYTGSAFTPSVKVVDTDGKALKKATIIK